VVILVGCDIIVWAYLRAVPAGDTRVTTDAGERGDVGLSVPAVLGDQTVGAIGAGQRGQGAASVIVSSVVGDGDGRGKAGKAKTKGGDGELHIDGVCCGGLVEKLFGLVE
jgi:hypothetical protein